MGTDLTYAAARAAWLDDARFRELSPRTTREYDRVSAALGAFLGDHERSLAALRAADVRRWLLERPAALKPASVAAYVRALRTFSRWCAGEYRIAEPLAGLRPPRVEPSPVPIFSPDQLRALLDAAPLHLAYAITLLAETGLRVSEAIAVELDDLAGGWLRVRRGKGGRPRHVPVSDILARATDAYLAQTRAGLAEPACARLLVNSRGRAWTRDALRHALNRVGRRAQISGVRVSPHTFRHQFAHDVAFAGGSLIALRDVLGHRSVTMVERYAVPDDEARRELVQRRTPLHQLRSGR